MPFVHQSNGAGDGFDGLHKLLGQCVSIWLLGSGWVKALMASMAGGRETRSIVTG